MLRKIYSLPLCQTAMLYCTHVFPSVASEENTEYDLGGGGGFNRVLEGVRCCGDGDAVSIFMEQEGMCFDNH